MSKDKHMSAREAIAEECRTCQPGIRMSPAKCKSTVCKLNIGVNKCRSSVKRVKAHCLDCAAQDTGETRHEAVRSCTGRLLRENGNSIRWIDSDGRERGVCFLHPYRLGKNPYRPKRTLTPAQIAFQTTGQNRFRNAGSIKTRKTTTSTHNAGDRPG